jgi:hypothetical protein
MIELLDVAAFRVRDIHRAASVVKLGIQWDDWVVRGRWQLSDAFDVPQLFPEDCGFLF